MKPIHNSKRSICKRLTKQIKKIVRKGVIVSVRRKPGDFNRWDDVHFSIRSLWLVKIYDPYKLMDGLWIERYGDSYKIIEDVVEALNSFSSCERLKK